MNSTDLINLQPEQLGDVYLRHGKVFAQAFRKVPNNRAYATDAVTERGGIALARGVWRTLEAANARDDNTLDQVLLVIAPFVTTALQSWRPGPETPLPKPWRDEVTGALLPNPFAVEPEDINGQTILFERDPELATYYRRLADNPYQLLADLADERARRDFLRSLKFGQREFDNNPFRGNLNEPAVAQAQSDFVRQHDELTVEVWRSERATVIWPWSDGGNMTELGRCFTALKANPVAGVIDGGVLQLAGAIDKNLVEALAQAERETIAIAQNRMKQLQPTSR